MSWLQGPRAGPASGQGEAALVSTSSWADGSASETSDGAALGERSEALRSGPVSPLKVVERRAQKRRESARRNDDFWPESALEAAERQGRQLRSARKTDAPPGALRRAPLPTPDPEPDVKRQIELASRQLEGIDALAASAEQAGRALGADVPNDEVRRIFDGYADGAATDPFHNSAAYVGRAARRR